jgi:hypothetical protein
MSYQHKKLAAGSWNNLSFIEQMANIGSEIERALNWQIKKNAGYAQKAFERALELIDLSLDNNRNYAHLKEVTRMREAIVDYFSGANQFMSSVSFWRNYFLPFVYASRRNH